MPIFIPGGILVPFPIRVTPKSRKSGCSTDHCRLTVTLTMNRICKASKGSLKPAMTEASRTVSVAPAGPGRRRESLVWDSYRRGFADMGTDTCVTLGLVMAYA